MRKDNPTIAFGMLRRTAFGRGDGRPPPNFDAAEALDARRSAYDMRAQLGARRWLERRAAAFGEAAGGRGAAAEFAAPLAAQASLAAAAQDAP